MAKAAKKATAKASKPEKKEAKPKDVKPKAKAAAKEKAPPLKTEKKPKNESEEVAVVAMPENEAESAPEVAKPKTKAKKPSKASAAKSAALAEESKKWSDMRDKYGADKAVNYSMSGVFEANTSIQHKVLGWGWIVSVQNDRLEVLFEDGAKTLISNYKR